MVELSLWEMWALILSTKKEDGSKTKGREEVKGAAEQDDAFEHCLLRINSWVY